MSLSVTKPVIGQPNATEDPKTITGLTDIETWGNANDTKINSILSAWKPLFTTHASAFAAAGGAGTYFVVANGLVLSAAASSGTPSAVCLDPADYAVAGYTTKIRLRATAITNATAPAITFTMGIHPFTLSGGSGQLVLTLAAATFSIAVASPAATSKTTVTSAEITMPAVDTLIPGVVFSGSPAANSLNSFIWQFQYRYT